MKHFIAIASAIGVRAYPDIHQATSPWLDRAAHQRGIRGAEWRSAHTTYPQRVGFCFKLILLAVINFYYSLIIRLLFSYYGVQGTK